MQNRKKGTYTVSMASKMRRKITKKIHKGERRAIQEKKQAERALKKEAYNRYVTQFNAETETMDNMLLFWLYSLYQVEGYVKRLEPWYKKCELTSSCIRGGYVTIPELGKILKEERDFELEDISGWTPTPDIRGERDIVLKTIDDMIIFFSYVTYETYRFKTPRLGRLIEYIGKISQKLTDHTLTFADIENTMKAKHISLVRRPLKDYVY